jgi:X-X-X-Leu-X-X-Gly heptad repeat protein
MTSLAQNREQHIQRFHDQLVSWQEDINRLRAKTFTANSYVQGQMNKMVTRIDKGIQELTEKLIEVAETGDRRVYSALETMESSWGTLRENIGEMMERMRNKGEAASDQIQDKAGQLQDKAGRMAGQLQDKAGQLQDKAERMADDLGDSVQRGVNKARQAVNEATQGGGTGSQGGAGGSARGGRSETTISAEAGKRPQQGSSAQQMQDSGQQEGGQQTQGVGASVTVTRTRSH